MNNDIEAAYIASYDEHVDSLYRFILFKVTDSELAWDLTQETFLKVWQKIQAGAVIDNIPAYLYRSARNLVIDYYRKHKTERLELLQDKGFDPIQEDIVSIEDKSELLLIYESFKEISDHYQEVLTLRFIEGRTPKEIADLLEVTENVVSVRLNRALKALRSINET